VSPQVAVGRFFDRLFEVLDSEGVVFFQVLVYLHTAAMGYSARFQYDGLPPVLDRGLANTYSIWPWMCMGVLVCLVGKILSANTATTPYWVYTTGLIGQFIGDVCAMGAFAGYVMSILEVRQPGEPVAAVWLVAALAECAFFLAIRDIRRFTQAERAVRTWKD